MSSSAGIRFRHEVDPAVLDHAAAALGHPVGPGSHRDVRGVHRGPALPDADGHLALDAATLGAPVLYVYDDGRRLAYATSMQVLAALDLPDLTPDPRGVAELLGGRPVASTRTVFARVRRLPAHGRLQLADGRHRPPASDPAATAAAPGPEATGTPLDRLDAVLAQAMHAALDGPAAGLLFSGGLKSTAMAAAARRAGRTLPLFTLAAAGGDAAAARSLAAAMDQPLHVQVPDTSALCAGFDTWLATLDEPLGDPASLALAHLAQQLRGDGLRTVGGDDGGLLFTDGSLHAPTTGRDPRPWLRDRSVPWPGRAPAAALPVAPWPQACHRPLLDAGLAGWVAALQPGRRGAADPRALLRDGLARLLPAGTPLPPAPPLALAAAPLLQPLQRRLFAALTALRGEALADVLDLDAIAGLVGAHFAGEARSAATIWRLALLLLWWAEVLPGWRRTPAPESAAVSAAAGTLATAPAWAPATAPAVQATVEPAAGAAAAKAANGSQATAPARQRLVVYTVLVGAKETLADPLAALPPGASTDLELDFVCLSDNPALQSAVWRIVPLPSGHLAPEKLSRRPKALPHEYFPDAEYSLYIDNTVAFRRLPQASDLATTRPALFKAFRHATRVNPEQEATAVAMLGYDDAATICNQMAFYAARRPLETITPLTTATVLLRQHHDPALRRFGVLWWESILAFSKRDQLSFDFARQEAGCEVEYFEGSTHDNTWIRWQGSLDQHRVKASFDDRRYAWLHRDDPAALADPRAHFLRHHAGSDAAYLKPSPLLEFVCQTQRSSLGRHVSPRRAVAEALEPLLAPHRAAGRRWLLVRVHGETLPQAFDAAELEAAARVLSMFMSPAQGTLIDIQAAELQPDGKVFVAAQPPCDAVIVLGAAAARLPALLFKLQRLLDPARGLLAAVLAGPATLAEAAAVEAWLARQTGAAAQAQLHAARHDDLRDPLPNGLLALQWQAAAPAPAAPAAAEPAPATA